MAWHDASMPVSERSIVVAATDQVSTSLRDEVVILGLSDGVYYGLNEVGARVWALVREPMTVGQIRSVVVAEFDVDPDRALSDVLALLDDLVRHGLVEIRDVPSA